MSWIASHQNLKEHPKTSDLAARMGWTRPETIGRLHMLWWWCLDYAISGDLSRFTAAQLAAAMETPTGEGEKLVRALIETRWLDAAPRLRIHDWWEHVGLFLKMRWKKTPERYKEIQEWYTENTASDPFHVPSPIPAPLPTPIPPPITSPAPGPFQQTNQQTEQTVQTVPHPTNPPATPPDLVTFPTSEAEARRIGEMMTIPGDYAVSVWEKAKGRKITNFGSYLKTAWQRHTEAGAAIAQVNPANKPSIHARIL